LFKHSSEHLQHAATRQTTKNEAGVDESVWVSPDDEYRLLNTKLDGLRAECAAINSQITLSRARLNGQPGNPMPPTAYARACQKKSAIVKLIVEIEMKMRPLKDKMREDRDRRFATFEQAFLFMAKEMLAHEVFDRIFVAAAHRAPPPSLGKQRAGQAL
jgi:hypothetical protein